MYGINAPELRGETRQAAYDARARLLELIAEHGDFADGEATLVTIRTYRDEQEKYGRYLCDVMTRDGSDTLNRILVNEGYARVYLP